MTMTTNRLLSALLALVTMAAASACGTEPSDEASGHSDTDSDSDSDSDSDADSDTDTDTDADTDTDTDADADTDTDTDADSDSDTGSAGTAGCGANPLESGTFFIDVDGVQRMYVLDVPASYNANDPYRLFFTWHWLGGHASDVVNNGYYGLKAASNGTAVFVSPEGLEGGGGGVSGTGWWNANGGDIRFLEEMLKHFFNNLCIDTGRIFSTGFSFGGMMSNTVACQKSDVFRAIAPMSGSMMGGCRDDTAGPVAFFGAHGDGDLFVTTQSGRDARDVMVARNNCSQQTRPAGAPYPDYCVAYEGCDDGYPVFWCEFSGDHQMWNGAAAPLWNFFQSF